MLFFKFKNKQEKKHTIADCSCGKAMELADCGCGEMVATKIIDRQLKEPVATNKSLAPPGCACGCCIPV